MFKLERSAFRVCVSRDYGYSPFPIVRKCTWCKGVNLRILVSFPIQNGDRFVFFSAVTVNRDTSYLCQINLFKQIPRINKP